MRSNPARAALIACGVLAAAWSAAQAVVTGVTAKKIGEGVEVAIQGTNLTAPRQIRVNGNTSYLLEFDAKLGTKPRRFTVGYSGLKLVNFGWFRSRPPKVRVHLSIRPQDKPVLARSGQGWTVALNVAPEPVPIEVKAARADAALMKSAIAMLASEQSQPKEAPVKTIVQAVAAKAVANQARTIVQAAIPQTGKTITEAALAAVAVPKSQEPFPDRVPPLEPARAARAATTTSPTVRTVSVNMDKADVLQVYKALARQAGVNIVVAPDVSPADKPMLVTLSMNRVTLEEALSFASAMTGTKYARIGNTFVVTLAKNFADAMRTIAGRDNANTATRVVAIKSGEGEQIRTATLQAITQEGRGGWYDIIVQGANATDADEAQAAPSTPPGSQPANGATPATAQANAPKARSYYLMVVGDPKRIEEVAQHIRDLDARIVSTFAVASNGDVGSVVVPVYSNQPERIKGMLERLLANSPRSSEYSISHTMVKDLPEGEESTTVMLVMGPNSELDNLRKFAVAVDEDMCAAAGIKLAADGAGRERIYEVVGLKYIEPSLAEFDLKSRVRGLYVTVLPDVVKPGLTGQVEADRQERPQDQPTGPGGTPAAGATQQDRAELKRPVGREPMKLMLRGTRDQIARAKAYLAQVDIPPKQVALELRVMDLSREDAIKAGVDWNLLTGGIVKFLRLNNSQQNLNNSVGFRLDGSNTNGEVVGMLDKIANKNNLIARPNVLAMDGRTTDLFVGDVVRYVESIISGTNGPTVSTKELPVGVRLNVLPRIGDGGAITMMLKPSVSFIRGFTTVEVPGTQIQLPQTSERTATSELTIMTGETIAIGGLIQDQDRREVTGIPILMDIPIIGQLFRKTSNTRTRTEIVIFLTARVVDGPATAGNVPLPPKNEDK